jgi:hypothetical protein
MGRGRARAGAVRATLGALVVIAAAALAGCGAQSHPNQPRPQVSTRVSITVGTKAVTVQPARIAVGPERNQQIPQNRSQEQPRIEGDERPLNVVFVAANQTGSDSEISLRGPTDADSNGPVLARSPDSFQADLPTGTYTVVATGVPGARPAKLVVGPYRASSDNDVLLP